MGRLRRLIVGRIGKLDRRGFGGRHLRLSREAVARHQIENDVAPFFRFCRIRGRRVFTRRFRNAGEQSGFVQRQVLRLFVEVNLSARFDAVRVRPEKNVVRVQLHDLLLRVVTLDLKRQQPLVYLATISLLFCEKQILSKLLRQGRATFHFFRGQVFPRRAGNAHRVDADVIVKARVLDGEDRVLHYGRNLVILQRDAFLEREFADHRLAVVGVDARDDARAVGRKRGNFAGRLGIVQLIRRDNAGQAACREREQQHRRKPEAAQQMLPLARRGVDDSHWFVSFKTIEGWFCGHNRVFLRPKNALDAPFRPTWLPTVASRSSFRDGIIA